MRIELARYAGIQAGIRPPTPERVAKAMRRALRQVANAMREQHPNAVQEGYFALGLERAISRKMTGPQWEQEASPVWTGATHYMEALGSGWPELLAKDNVGSARQYRVAVLAVMADGFVREGA